MGFFTFGDVLQNRNDSIDAMWTFNGEVGYQQLPFAEPGIFVLQLVSNDLALETFIQLFLHNRLKDVPFAKFCRRMAYHFFSFHASIVQERAIDEDAAIFSVNHHDHLFEPFKGFFVFLQPCLSSFSLPDVACNRFKSWRSFPSYRNRS